MGHVFRVAVRWRCDEFGICLYKEVKNVKSLADKGLEEIFIIVGGDVLQLHG